MGVFELVRRLKYDLKKVFRRLKLWQPAICMQSSFRMTRFSCLFQGLAIHGCGSCWRMSGVNSSSILLILRGIFRIFIRVLISNARVPRPKVLKSHEAYTLQYPKVIYIVRDPRAVAISLIGGCVTVAWRT